MGAVRRLLDLRRTAQGIVGPQQAVVEQNQWDGAIGLFRSRLLDESRPCISYASPRSLYETLAAITRANLELLSDAIYFSGSVEAHCSVDVDDVQYGGIGMWTADGDRHFSGAIVNPPFIDQVVTDILETFSSNCSATSSDCSFCRVAILLWTKNGPVRVTIQNPSCPQQLSRCSHRVRLGLGRIIRPEPEDCLGVAHRIHLTQF